MPYTKDGSVETRFVDFDDPKKYESLIFGADVVIRSVGFIPFYLNPSLFILPFNSSLLPANMHHKVAEVCIAAGKSLITASYISHEMEKLNFR